MMRERSLVRAITLVCVSVATVVVVAGLSASASAASRPRCSLNPQVAAHYILAVNHLTAHVIAVKRWKIPSFEPSPSPSLKRLYLVRFRLLKPNVVLGPGVHEFFAYVTRPTAMEPWCFKKGGSGP